MQGNYIQQTKHPLLPESSAPIKTFEGHRFFAAFARQADQVLKWDPDTIPLHAQFVHRGFDQVVTAKVRAWAGVSGRSASASSTQASTRRVPLLID